MADRRASIFALSAADAERQLADFTTTRNEGNNSDEVVVPFIFEQFWMANEHDPCAGCPVLRPLEAPLLRQLVTDWEQHQQESDHQEEQEKEIERGRKISSGLGRDVAFASALARLISMEKIEMLNCVASRGSVIKRTMTFDPDVVLRKWFEDNVANASSSPFLRHSSTSFSDDNYGRAPGTDSGSSCTTEFTNNYPALTFFRDSRSDLVSPVIGSKTTFEQEVRWRSSSENRYKAMIHPWSRAGAAFPANSESEANVNVWRTVFSPYTHSTALAREQRAAAPTADHHSSSVHEAEEEVVSLVSIAGVAKHCRLARYSDKSESITFNGMPMTAPHFALAVGYSGNLPLMEFLCRLSDPSLDRCKDFPAEINRGMLNGFLLGAVATGQYEVVKTLVKDWKNDPTVAGWKTPLLKEPIYPVQMACFTGNAKMLKFLCTSLGCGISPDLSPSTTTIAAAGGAGPPFSWSDRHPLFLIYRCPNPVELAKVLLEDYQCDVNLLDSDHWSLLSYVVYEGRTELLEYLVSLVADVRVEAKRRQEQVEEWVSSVPAGSSSTEQQPTTTTTSDGKLSSAATAVAQEDNNKRSPDFSIVSTDGGRTLLHLACGHGEPEILKPLLEVSGTMEEIQQQREGLAATSTDPVDQRRSSSSTERKKKILINIDQLDSQQLPALHHYAGGNSPAHRESARLLLAAGADANCKISAAHCSILHTVVLLGDVKMAKILIEQGKADTNTKRNKEGKTAAECGLTSWNEEMKRFFGGSTAKTEKSCVIS